ncbi:MAG: MG2 domain-containing protein, partial [Bryobacteraceae bacterium]
MLVKGSFDIDETPLEAHAVTDAKGFATLQFKIPADTELDGNSVETEIEGTKGDFHQTHSVDLESVSSLNITLQTDKPIHQPGQTLHIRALCFASSKHAKAGLPLVVSIKDPEDTTAFLSHVTTNSFGVASTDWQMPANLRLGDYMIRAETDETVVEHKYSQLIVRISRYDLPEFRVTAKPDRAYYLPGQKPKVEIAADYLFGKPVPSARIRVVRETERIWNFKLQKWDVEEGESVAGTADAKGRFTASLNIEDAYEGWKEESAYAPRVKDVSYTAYATDPLTGRTEQRRFDVRATHHEIHIYVFGRRFCLESQPTCDWYVSTSYADGTPAASHVTGTGIGTVLTNRYGIAQIRIPKNLDELNLSADDGQGHTGRFTVPLGAPDLANVHVRTEKTLYRSGEPVNVEIASTVSVSTVILSVTKDLQLLDSFPVHLTKGHASVILPWRKEFVHAIKIGIAPPDPPYTSDSPNSNGDAQTVIFPMNDDLLLAIKPAQATYRPGEQASADVFVRLPDGSPATAALGVAVVDAAVAERASADSET